MGKGVNKVLLLGNAGKDPEFRTTAGGISVATFSLATADRIKRNDEWVDATEWHNVVAFGRTAEIIRDYVTKGSQVYLEGKIQTRSWDDKESGQKRYKTEVLVNELTLLGSPDAGGKRDRAQENSYDKPSSRTIPPMASSAVDITDDDIPF